MIEDLKKFDLVDYVESEIGDLIKISDSQYRVNPCPICGHNDCFTVYGNSNNFHCFSCLKGGDISDLLIATGKASNVKESLQYLGIKSDYKTDYNNNKQSNTHSEIMTETAIADDLNTHCDYFKTRGLSAATIDKYDLKIDNGFAVLPGGIKRNITSKSYLNPKGEQISLFNIDYLKGTGVVFVCEGIFDALSLEELGYRAISLNSVSNASKLKDHITTCKAFLICATDNDDAGIKAKDEIKKICQENKVGFDSLQIKSPYKDVNEWLVADRKGLSDSIKQLAMYSTTEDLINGLLNKKKQVYISTGINKFDNALGGGLVPDLYVIGGTPAAGKSAFALQIAQGVSESQRKVLYFTLELSADEITSRNVSRISYQANKDDYLTAIEVNTGNLTPEKQNLFCTIKDDVITKMDGLTIVTPQKRTIEEIRNEVTRFKQYCEDTPIVIVDYLQNLQGKEAQSDKQVIDDAVTGMKAISNDFNTPVLVISSLNREGYNSGGMSSFKESGGIEYSAAIAIQVKPSKNGLETLKARKDNPKNKAYSIIETEIDIVKNRHGMAQSFYLNFCGAGNTFIE